MLLDGFYFFSNLVVVSGFSDLFFYFHCVVLFVFFLSIIDLLSFWAFRVFFFRSGLDLTGFHQVPMTFFGSCFLIFKSASSLLGFVCDAKGFAYIFRNLGRLD